jgi:DNA-binding LacI/PurR family transcriptional regulator
MVSQEDVARKAGVSSMTVSRVVNNDGKVKEHTRQKILKAIESLGYYQNVMARGLCINRTDMLSVVTPTVLSLFSTQYFIELLKGIEQCCAESGFRIVLTPHASIDSGRDYDKPYLQRLVDGLIVINPLVNDPKLKELAEKNVPCVIVDGKVHGVHGVKSSKMVQINSNNFAGAVKIVSFLIDKSYKNIAHISGPVSSLAALERSRGYKYSLQKYGLPFKPAYMTNGDFTEQTGFKLMKKLLALSPRPDAVFCSNDFTALGAMDAIKESGLSIPDDIAIAGFDDLPVAQYLKPPLTTVRQMVTEVGYKAAEVLISLIRHKKNPSQKRVITFNTELIVRESA